MHKLTLKYILFLLSVLLISCGTSTKEQFQEVELMNHRAFNFRYTNLDSMKYYANKALDLSLKYNVGIAESYNNLALAAYMGQDFLTAENYYNKVQSATRNQLELLLADIGMLKVCTRSSANKRFYDYETKIKKRLRRLNDEFDALDSHDRKRLTFAESDYHLTASIYYYYMQQDLRAKDELEQIDSYELAASDSLQWTYYEYMMSSVEMLGGSTFEEEVKLEFDSLLNILFYARAKNLIYLEANILETFVEKFQNKEWCDIAMNLRGASIAYLSPEQSDSVSLYESMSLRAIECFEEYGDYYQIAGAKRALGDIYFSEGQYEDALAFIEDALVDINDHYHIYNAKSSFKVPLTSYAPDDSIAVDLIWMENDSISTVPQWLANIRQSLSMVYAALGNKPASDYNRNVYLDLMDKTRQDKEQENRLEQLELESKNLNLLFWFIFAITLVGGLLLFYFNRRWRKRNAKRIEKLSITAELCNYITSSIPTEAEDQEELLNIIHEELDPKLNDIFNQRVDIVLNDETSSLELKTSGNLDKDDADILSLLTPYVNWAYQYGSTFLHLAEDFKQLEKERYSHELHIIENKRKNLEKRTCMSIVLGITPFMDRALNEINRLNDGNQTEEQKHERYIYIQELIEKINEYNDIMSLWIKMRQGTLSLHIENFGLHELFETISKSKRAYEQKNQSLIVDDTSSFVKADRALTLFMINTLCENARKYTPEGGTIHLYAQETEQYVEISVQDTGIGLSESDCRRILEEKVYDSSKIGLSEDSSDCQQKTLKENKGFGFGLMNCKGIIDKYKKTNSIFSVCLFGIDSKLGEGSRFYFRLPKGIMRTIILCICLLTTTLSFGNNDYQLKASSFADSIYYCNIDGNYELAISYADSACHYLNLNYLHQYPESRVLMGMKGGDRLAELDWWENGVNTDYHVILDIRNETAVAALALGLWDTYKTNNNGYTRLYKLLGQDNTLDAFCAEMQSTASNRTVLLVIFILVIIVFLIMSYSLFFRQELLFRINVQQVLGINKKVLDFYALNAMNNASSEQMLDVILGDISSIHTVDGLAMCMIGPDGRISEPLMTKGLQSPSTLKDALIKSAQESRIIHLSQDQTYVYPLAVDFANEKNKIGSFAFVHTQNFSEKNEVLLRDLILNYLATVIYQTVIRLSVKHLDIEVAEDEKRRALHEDNLIHVQNMMLDNCLSTLKHETMYYPNRIKQIVSQLTNDINKQEEDSLNKDMSELMSYYKDIFTVLSDCANRQLDSIKFTRAKVNVGEIQKHLDKYFNKISRKQGLDWSLNIESTSSLCVLGDFHLLSYLVENLVDAIVEMNPNEDSAVFDFKTQIMDGFVRFDFMDYRGEYEQIELNQIFYPNLERMQNNPNGKLKGTQFLTMRQIIRDHDELCRHRGCRINAEVIATGGYKIWFTIPKV